MFSKYHLSANNVVRKTNNDAVISVQNYDLYELAKYEGLSVRTVNVCKHYNLTDLQKILHYSYIEKEDFRHLRNCGNKSIEELNRLCEKYQKFCIISSDTKLVYKNKRDIDISEDIIALIEAPLYCLISQENLSIRSQNVCIDNNLLNLHSLISFFWEKRSFIDLRNCGQKSNLELIRLCEKYEKYFERPIVELNISERSLNPMIVKVNSLTVKQKQIINNLLLSRFNDLSVRSKNALNSYLCHDISLKNLINTIFSDTTFNVNNLRNVGEKSIVELNGFLEEIQGQIGIASNYQDELEIELKLFETFLIKHFPLNKTITKIVRDIDLLNGFPIFKILNSLVDNDILLEIKEKQIFINEFCTSDKSEIKTLNELSLDLGITRERVRQIRKMFLNEFDTYFKFVTQHEVKSLVNYNIDLTATFIDISDDLIDSINNSEKVQFNRLFIIRIFAILYGDKYKLVGNLTRNIHGRDYQLDKWTKTYLVDSKLTSVFNFNEFFNDVNTRLSSKIEEDYCFNFQSYVLTFFLSDDYDLLDRIFEVTEYLLFSEFELCIDNQENIVFLRNTKKQLIQYVIDVLREKRKPLTTNELFILIEKKYPGITKSPEALRGTCQRDPNLIFFGRSSTYGLKVWENELNIKGGTIRDIVEDYLQMQAKPIHIDVITKYVKKFRNTNSKSVYSNLKVDDRRRFVFFCGQLIGLSSLDYLPTTYTEAKINNDRKTWEESFLSLQKFADVNKRLPSNSGDEVEVKLYRFMKLQLNKAIKNNSYDKRIDNIIELTLKYNYKRRLKKSLIDLDKCFIDLIEFVINNKRYPNSRKTDEKILYRFFNQQKKLYQNDKLSIDHVNKLLEIERYLNQIK